MDIQTGTPPESGRYVVWFPCASLQIREWCEPAIATFHGGRWHTVNEPLAWIGPLPVVHTKTGEISDKPPCAHETTRTAQTGDGRDVETCLDCGEHIYIGPMPEEPEYDL